MHWKFWQPKHTVASVSQRILAGLRDGSVILDEPLADEPFEDDLDADGVVLQIDVAEGTSDAAILEIVKEHVSAADIENRSHGGNGLRLGKMIVAFPKVRVALRPRHETNAV